MILPNHEKPDADDHARLIGKLLDEVKPRKIVRKVIEAAYAAGYERQSDGITLMPELAFASLKMKHPTGVGRDWLYYMGQANPFLPARRSSLGEDGPHGVNSDWAARLWADNWFRDALIDFGHPIRARIWWLGLRLGAWYGWHCHRLKNHPGTIKTNAEGRCGMRGKFSARGGPLGPLLRADVGTLDLLHPDRIQSVDRCFPKL